MANADQVVALIFGIRVSTVQLLRFVKSIKKLAAQFIHMPNEKESERQAKRFESICSIPCIIGCIDGSHIASLAPKEGYRDFVNRNGWTSYSLRAVVDSDYK